MANPFKNAGEIVSTLCESRLIELFISTVSRTLSCDVRVPGSRPAKKPRLTPEMRENRLEFCYTYADWTKEDWILVAFSDESAFEFS